MPKPDGAPGVRILQAGAGYTNLTYVLAKLGGIVAALDFAKNAKVINDALHQHRLRWPLPPKLVARMNGRAEVSCVPPSSIQHLTLDWFDPRLEAGQFDLVIANNSLRLSRKKYWRRSIERFHELLAPGGIVITLNANALAIRDEVEDITSGVGLVPLQRPTESAFAWMISGRQILFEDVKGRSLEKKYYLGLWPTGM
jgi:hypothetical protein